MIFTLLQPHVISVLQHIPHQRQQYPAWYEALSLQRSKLLTFTCCYLKKYIITWTIQVTLVLQSDSMQKTLLPRYVDMFNISAFFLFVLEEYFPSNGVPR